MRIFTWPRRLGQRLRTLGLGVIAALVAVAVGIGVVTAIALQDDDVSGLQAPRELPAENASGDPFAFDPDQREDFERRAAFGLSHVLFVKSPGGVYTAAARTARWRDRIDEVAADSGADPSLLEAMVLLESAGRPEAVAGGDPAGAAGLAQIVAATGSGLLGMRVDLERSRRLTKKIARNELRAGQATLGKRAERQRRRAEARLPRLRERRARVDERFDPDKALAGAGRYLKTARARFGRQDLATESYHMGIANLERVIRAYVGPSGGDAPVAQLAADRDLSYARLYFESSPASHANAYDLLSGFGDDSATYYWRVLAAREIMRLWRADQANELGRLSELHLSKATAEEVFHPRDKTKVYEDPEALEDAYRDGELVRLPDEPRRLRFRIGRQLGQLARRLDARRRLYRGLRPEALATLAYMARKVHEITGRNESLVVTSAVRDQRYQEALADTESEATQGYSLHTTGYAFDIWRNYRSRAQERAFTYLLNRLRALAVLDYAVEPAAIHITVSDAAQALTQLSKGD